MFVLSYWMNWLFLRYLRFLLTGPLLLLANSLLLLQNLSNSHLWAALLWHNLYHKAKKTMNQWLTYYLIIDKDTQFSSFFINTIFCLQSSKDELHYGERSVYNNFVMTCANYQKFNTLIITRLMWSSQILALVTAWES